MKYPDNYNPGHVHTGPLEWLKCHICNPMKAVADNQNQRWEPCMHDNCQECHGTGIKLDGTSCIHDISCPCPKCTPRYI